MLVLGGFWAGRSGTAGGFLCSIMSRATKEAELEGPTERCLGAATRLEVFVAGAKGACTELAPDKGTLALR